MNRNLDYYILRLPNYLSNEVCDNILKEIKNFDFKEHTFYNVRDNNFKNKSGEQELECSWENLSINNFVIDKIWVALKTYIETYKFHWFSGWQGFSAPRFNKYSENKKMAEHCDHIQSLFDGERKGVPILTVLGVLNDDYEGGEFVMFENQKIEMVKGDLIIFPSNFLYPHRVEPVTRGTRYSYISWVW